MELRIVVWTLAHGLLFLAFAAGPLTTGRPSHLTLLLVFVPIVGIVQSWMVPAVEDRWTWPVLTCAGGLMALFVCCPWPVHVGLMLGLAQFHVFTAAGYRWGPLWLPASALGWLNGVLAGCAAADCVFGGVRSNPLWFTLAATVLGLVYGLTTALVFLALRERDREPGRPWASPAKPPSRGPQFRRIRRRGSRPLRRSVASHPSPRETRGEPSRDRPSGHSGRR